VNLRRAERIGGAGASRAVEPRGLSEAGRRDPGAERSDREDRGKEHDDQPTPRAVVEAPARRRPARCWSKPGSRSLRKTLRLPKQRIHRSRGTGEMAPRRIGAPSASKSRTFFAARKSLPRLFEGKGVPAERARNSHPSDGPGADCRPSLRVRTSALQPVRRGLRGRSAARWGREKVR